MIPAFSGVRAGGAFIAQAFRPAQAAPLIQDV